MIRSMLILVSLNEEQTYDSCFALAENGPDNKQIKYLLMGRPCTATQARCPSSQFDSSLGLVFSQD